MYHLNYLSILLILLAFFIFYNEFNTKLSIADMCLLAIAFIAILRASYNYIQLDNLLTLNKTSESFVNKRNKSKSKRIHTSNDDNDSNNSNNSNNDNDNTKNISNFINLKSEDSNEYLDIEADKDKTNKNVIQNLKYNYNDNDNYDNNEHLINRDAVNNIDALLGIGIHNKELFSDIKESNDDEESKDDIKSMFSPQIIIGGSKNDNDDSNKSNKWNSVFRGNEFHGDNNHSHTHCDREKKHKKRRKYCRKEKCDEKCDDRCDYRNNKRSPIVNPNGNSYDRMNYGSDDDIGKYTDKRKCGKYDDIREDEDGSIVVQNYKDAKSWLPGYTYLPPSNWDVPQKYPPVCITPSPDTIKLTGLVDRGLPINALELNPYNGKIADTENSVQLTNIGSMMPKFKYEEMPFSKPYI